MLWNSASEKVSSYLSLCFKLKLPLFFNVLVYLMCVHVCVRVHLYISKGKYTCAMAHIWRSEGNLRYQFSVPTLLETGSLCCWPLHIPGWLAHERPPLAAITDVCYCAWLCRGSRDLNSGPRACADSTPPLSHFSSSSIHHILALSLVKIKETEQGDLTLRFMCAPVPTPTVHHPREEQQLALRGSFCEPLSAG